MTRKTDTRWGIAGNCGLYIGQWQSRRQAIAEHVETRRYPWDHRLASAIWKECRDRGDYCVKLTITWTPKTKRSAKR